MTRQTSPQLTLFTEIDPAPTCADAPSGLYQAPIIRLRAVRESTMEAPLKVRVPKDIVAALTARFGDADREVLVVVLLDVKNNVIAIDPVSVGALDGALVCLRELFTSAILGKAASIILAHNHPSNDVTPSPEDILTTRKVIEAGRLLEISVLDHIILSQDPERYTSLREKLGSTW